MVKGAIPVCVQWGLSTDGMWLRDHEKTRVRGWGLSEGGLGLQGVRAGNLCGHPLGRYDPRERASWTQTWTFS